MSVCMRSRDCVCVRVCSWANKKDVSWFVTNDHETTLLDLLLHFFPRLATTTAAVAAENITKICSLQVHQSKSVLNQVNITIKTIAKLNKQTNERTNGNCKSIANERGDYDYDYDCHVIINTLMFGKRLQQ